MKFVFNESFSLSSSSELIVTIKILTIYFGCVFVLDFDFDGTLIAINLAAEVSGQIKTTGSLDLGKETTNIWQCLFSIFYVNKLLQLRSTV